MRGEAAIIGIGQTSLGRHSGRSALSLQEEAVHKALDDAGITLEQIDGFLTTPVTNRRWSTPCGVVANHLALRPAYMNTIDIAGVSGIGLIHQAAMLVATGQCRTVLCVAGQDQLSLAPTRDVIKSMVQSGVAHPEFEMPYWPLIPSLYALIAQRHMFEYGTTPEQMAQVAVELRRFASLNPDAHKRKPITIDEVLASPMVSSPFHVLDCSLISDGAAAAVVTARKNLSAGNAAPIHVLGYGFGNSHGSIGEHLDLTSTAARQSGAQAFRMAGMAPADIDVAELYDCFSITVIIELEDLGFCPKGEGGRFVSEGNIGLRGSLPTTTHGGLLSAGHPGLSGGFFHVLEGVRQLRGEAGERQVENANVGLVHGNGGILAAHGTMILGTADVL